MGARGRAKRIVGANEVEGIALGPSPCDDCRFRARCNDERLACEAFAVFMKTGNEKRWAAAPRAPDASTFERLRAFTWCRPKVSCRLIALAIGKRALLSTLIFLAS